MVHMIKYPKIQSVFKRDPETHYKTFLPEYACDQIRYLKECDWLFTEKVDGTNIRIYWDGRGTVIFGGRTDNAQLPMKLLNKLKEKFTNELFEEVFEDYPVQLFGEGYGAKIQKGGELYRPDQGFIMFDCIIQGNWVKYDTVESIADSLGCVQVPLLGIGTINDCIKYIHNNHVSEVAVEFRLIEGIVLRPEVPIFYADGSPIMTKLKLKDYGLPTHT